jgi:hypothetical protein
MAESDRAPGIARPIDGRVLEELEDRLERNVNDRISATVAALRRTGGPAIRAETTPQQVAAALERLINVSDTDPRKTGGIRIEADARGSRKHYIAYYASPAELTDDTPPALERAIREAGLDTRATDQEDTDG